MSKTAAKCRPKISGEFSVSLIIFSCTLLLDARCLQRKRAKNYGAFVLVHEGDRLELLCALTDLFNGSVLDILLAVLARISFKNINNTFV